MSYLYSKLQEITTIKTGKLDSNAAIENGIYPFFTCDPNTLRINTWAYDTEAVLLAGNNASGNYTAKYYYGQFNAYQRTYIIESVDREILNVRYLQYAMNQQLKLLKAMSAGSTTKFLKLGMLQNLEIPFPDIETQRRIADILSAYDDLIENNQKQIKLLEEAAQRLYKEWFVDLRFPGYENVKVVDGVPEGWEKAPLSDVIEKITTGLNPRQNFVLGHGDNYYVTIKNMGNNTIYLDDKCDRVDDAALEKINSRSDLKIGDILFSGIGTMGRVYLVSIPTNNWNVSESVFTIRANNRITKELLYLILLSSDMQKYCDNNAHGVAQRGIRMADLKAYPIILPSTSIIDSFTSVVKPIIEKTQSVNKQITKLAEARDRLLPKLMSGELEV